MKVDPGFMHIARLCRRVARYRRSVAERRGLRRKWRESSSLEGLEMRALISRRSAKSCAFNLTGATWKPWKILKTTIATA